MTLRRIAVGTLLAGLLGVTLLVLQGFVGAQPVLALPGGVLTLAALCGGALSLTLGGALVRKERPDALAERLAPHIEIVKPEGPGPFPVVLQFHGCGGQTGPDGGRNPIMRHYAEAAAAAGVAAVIVDSIAPRGISRADALAKVCRGRWLRGGERAGDVLVALDMVRGFDWVDPERLAVAGWSHGAWAIMDLLSMDLRGVRPHNLSAVPGRGLEGLKAAHLTYPFCGFPARTREFGWAWRPAARVVIAERDDLALEQDVRASIAQMEASGVAVETAMTPSVTHGFDEPRHEPGSTLRPAPEAAAAARAAYADWLRRVLCA